MIQQVLMQTISLRRLDLGVRALLEDLGFELLTEGLTDDDLAGVWGVSRAVHPRFAVLRAPGTSRGFIRLVEGPEDDETKTFHKRGLFNAEILTRDVETLFARLANSAHFDLVSALNTYDLSGAGGGAVSRSFATRGPGGAGFFFTQYLKVPPPRTLPVCEHLVGPMFNAALSTVEQSRVETFYEGVLGMQRRLAGRLTQAEVNRIIGLPDDWGFMMLVFKGLGDGLIEVDIHEHDVPQGPSVRDDHFRPGNAMLTLETEQLDALLERAAKEGFGATEPRVIEASPYGNRRGAVLRGPAGERVEIVASPLP